MKQTTEQKEANKVARREAKAKANTEARIKDEKEQNPVKSIEISIEWSKSRMWGSNPHATARVHFRDGSFEMREGFTCSGCGYDKESTVIAEIFNTFLKYKLWHFSKKRIAGGNGSTDEKNGNAPYGIYAPSKGTVYNSRGFSGGIGTNCYYAISEYIGGKLERVASGKTFDAYTYTDKRKRA